MWRERYFRTVGWADRGRQTNVGSGSEDAEDQSLANPTADARVSKSAVQWVKTTLNWVGIGVGMGGVEAKSLN